MNHDLELAKRLYATSPLHDRLNNIADAGYAVQAACTQMAAIPTIEQANKLVAQLRTLSHSVSHLRRVLVESADEKKGQAADLASIHIDMKVEHQGKQSRCPEKL